MSSADFQSSVEEVNPVSKLLKVTIPQTVVSSKFEERIKKAMRQAQIDGFRPGKAPRSMVEKVYGARLHSEIVEDLIRDSFQNAIEKHAVTLAGEPNLKIDTTEAGKDVSFTAELPVFAKPTITGYEKIAASAVRRPIADSEIDERILKRQERRQTFEAITDRTVAAKGDIIEGDAIVSIEGGPQARPEPISMELGSGRLLPELEAAILGMEIGSDREVTANLPADHADKNIRGKPATFKITLKGLKQKVLPKLNDEFVASLGEAAKTVAELKASVRASLEEERKTEEKAAAAGAILDVLLTKNDFMVPVGFVHDEIREMLVQAGYVDPQKVDPRKINADYFMSELGDVATRRARIRRLVEAISEQEKISLTPEEIRAEAQKMADQAKMDVATIESALFNPEHPSGYFVEARNNKVIDFLMTKATITWEAPKEVAAEGAEGTDAKVEVKEKKKSKKKKEE